MNSDEGYWFGVTFDEYLGKYIVDTTKEPFDMIRYPFISNVSETKQVRIILYYKTVWYRFSLQV